MIRFTIFSQTRDLLSSLEQLRTTSLFSWHTYETLDRRVHYYHVNFLHVPKNNKLIFEAVQVSEIQNLDKPPVVSVEPNTETGTTESDVDPIISFSNESSYLVPTVKAVGLDEEKIALFDRVSFIEDDRYFLTFPSDLTQSTMSYYSDRVSKNGGVFELDYVDAGGSGMDGYPNAGIGGAKIGGTWYPSDRNLTGMPVKLRDLDDSMILQWKVSQENAWGDKDKWMASINMIFDAGEADSEPDSEHRDYDLVIELTSHNVNSKTDDVTEGNKRVPDYPRD